MYRAKVFEVPYHLLHSEFGIAVLTKLVEQVSLFYVEGFVFGSDLFLLMIRQYLMSLSLSTLEVDAFHF
jgi:hypothetical protein